MRDRGSNNEVKWGSGGEKCVKHEKNPQISKKYKKIKNKFFLHFVCEGKTTMLCLKGSHFDVNIIKI